MKKILAALVALALIGGIYVSTQKEEVPNVPVKEIISSIEAEFDTISYLMEIDLTEEEVSELNKGFIEAYKIDPSLLEEGIIRCPMINLAVEEMVVLKVNEASKIEEVNALLTEHAAKVSKSFENYVPHNKEIADNFVLTAKGNYVFFAISENAERMEEIFNASLTAK